jgi:hypothetical protein
MPRWRLIASGAFVVAYLTFQIGYPALAWFSPRSDKFTWHMFAPRESPPDFSVIFRDGSSKALPNLLRRGGSPVRLFGPSVDQPRFVPPYLCRHWTNVKTVVIRYRRPPREVTIPCLSSER